MFHIMHVVYMYHSMCGHQVSSIPHVILSQISVHELVTSFSSDLSLQACFLEDNRVRACSECESFIHSWQWQHCSVLWKQNLEDIKKSSTCFCFSSKGCYNQKTAFINTLLCIKFFSESFQYWLSLLSISVKWCVILEVVKSPILLRVIYLLNNI